MVVYSLRTKTREERNRACNDNENDQGIFVSWRPKRRHGAIREKRPICSRKTNHGDWAETQSGSDRPGESTEAYE